MLMRATLLSVRATLAIVVFGFVFEASALPLSPKWMKANESIKVSEPPSGDLGGGAPGEGGGARDLPVPATLILFAVGIAGISIVRRKKQS